MWIDGHQYFDRDQDLAQRDQKAKLKQELMDKEKAAEEAAKPKGSGKGGANQEPKPPESTPPVVRNAGQGMGR